MGESAPVDVNPIEVEEDLLAQYQSDIARIREARESHEARERAQAGAGPSSSKPTLKRRADVLEEQGLPSKDFMLFIENARNDLIDAGFKHSNVNKMNAGTIIKHFNELQLKIQEDIEAQNRESKKEEKEKEEARPSKRAKSAARKTATKKKASPAKKASKKDSPAKKVSEQEESADVIYPVPLQVVYDVHSPPQEDTLRQDRPKGIISVDKSGRLPIIRVTGHTDTFPNERFNLALPGGVELEPGTVLGTPYNPEGCYVTLNGKLRFVRFQNLQNVPYAVLAEIDRQINELTECTGATAIFCIKLKELMRKQEELETTRRWEAKLGISDDTSTRWRPWTKQ